jgi:Leucine-rich repeat (LRR) protein
MPHKEDSIPTNWVTLKDQTSKAQFVSIHTGPMEEQDWRQIDFPEVEALALFFSASEYCLPTFLHTMPKLKVLIIYNYSSKRAILHGLPGFSSDTQLKSVLLQKLIVPPLYEYCRSWECLEKLSVCLCEGLGNMTLFDKAQALKFPKLVEINFDHCSDLEELPGSICSLTSLERLSVTNCHLIQKLPDDLGRLRSLRLLRLSTCPSLSMLPPSICRLQHLKFLDISLCMSLKDLPMEFDQLPKLKMLDMNECSGLEMLPKTLAKLSSLKRVICDEHTEQQWLAIKASAMPNLTVDVVEERFNLDWLDD